MTEPEIIALKTGKPARQLNTYDLMKVFAITLMVVDHLGHFFFPEQLWLRSIGRAAFPVFLFLVGYSCSWSNKPSLWLNAILLLMVGGATGNGIFPLNILFTIGICRMAMPWITRSRMGSDPIMLWLAGAIWLLPSIFLLEYGTQALLICLTGYWHRQGMLNGHYLLAIVLSWLTVAGIQTIAFEGMTPAEQIFSALSVGLSGLLCLLFRLKDIALPGPLETPLRLISRHAVWIYTGHLCLFMLLALALGQEWQWQWNRH